MNMLAQHTAKSPASEIEDLAQFIVGYLTNEDHPERSAFIGVPPSMSEAVDAIGEWTRFHVGVH